MAATAKPNKEQQDRTRAAIQTTQLVKRIQNYALGEKDDQDNPVEIDSNRLRAIEILLRKSLPDLSSVQMQADIEIDPGNKLAELMARIDGNSRTIKKD